MPASPVPWTLMIKYKKTGRLFFITHIDVETEEEALNEARVLGYPVYSDAFELTAKRIPVLIFPRKVDDDGPSNEPVPSEQTSSCAGFRQITSGEQR